MTWCLTKKAGCGSAKIQGFGKLIILQFFLYIFIGLETRGMEILFLKSDKLKIIQKPRYLKICHKNDGNFDECLKTSLEKFMKSVSEGSSDYEISSIDPVEIPFLEFNKNFTHFIWDIILNNLTISGLSRFKILDVTSDVENYTFEISLKTSSLNVTTEIFADGSPYMSISAAGRFSLNLIDVFATLIVHLNPFKSDSDYLTYFKVDGIRMELLPVSVHIGFDNYSDGGNDLDSELNNFLKKSGQEIFVYLKPTFQNILANISAAIANEILSRHPAETLLPD